MSSRSCPHEEELRQAIRAGESLEGYVEHGRECLVCRETLQVSAWLREVAVETQRTTSLAGAEAIWWRSQVVKKLCDQESRIDKRTRPLMVTQIVAVMLAAVTVIVLFLTSEPMTGLIGSLAGLMQGSGAATLATAAVISLLMGGLAAWQVSRDLG